MVEQLWNGKSHMSYWFILHTYSPVPSTVKKDHKVVGGEEVSELEYYSKSCMK